jgi:hypothetical protein
VLRLLWAIGLAVMPVATATLDRHLADPFGPIWLPLDGDRRVRLVDLTRRRMG